MKVLYEEFENLRAMDKAINTRPENGVFKNYDCASKDKDKSFTRTNTYEEAVELFNKGWDELLEEVKRGIAKNIKANVTTTKVRPRNDVVGYAPCVPNAILGLPQSMISTERTVSKVKAVTITYSMSVTCGYSEQQILDSGIVVLNIVNDLEMQGYRVRLNLEFFGSKEGNDLSVARVCVKDWRQPLDLKKLTFPVAHPSMFRRFGFRWLETTPNLTNRSYRSGYGSSHFKKNYANSCKVYRENGLLKENEYLLTAYQCIAHNFDKSAIIEEAGIGKLVKN